MRLFVKTQKCYDLYLYANLNNVFLHRNYIKGVSDIRVSS